jgi:hypothetical protein
MQEESLEQALKLQIQKRIEVESNASHLKSHIHDLQELLEALVLEVSTVVVVAEQEEKKDTRGSSTNISSTVDLNDIDGDDDDDCDPRQEQNDMCMCPSAMMERKDVLWMLKEIQIRIQNITSLTPSLTGNGNNPCSNQNDQGNPEDKDDVLPLKLHYETQLAKLQGQLTQIEEMLQDRTSCNANKEPPQARVGATLPTCTAAASTSTTTTIQEQINKYQRLEKRHGIMMKDMQQELQEKQKKIQSLEKELEVAGFNNKNNNPSSPPMAMMFQSPHKDLLIASLQEDLEERDLVIAELKAELEQQEGVGNDRDGVGIGLGNVAIGNEMMHPTTKDKGETNRMDSPWKRAGSRRHRHHTAQEADKVKIKYMEGIIHSLEKKVEYLEQRCNTNHGQSPPSMQKQEKQYQSPLNSKTLTTRDHLHDWRVDDDHTLVAPGGYSSLQVEDMELEIAELMARLKDCQEEKMLLEQELSQWKEGNGMTKRGESHAGPQ